MNLKLSENTKSDLTKILQKVRFPKLWPINYYSSIQKQTSELAKGNTVIDMNAIEGSNVQLSLRDMMDSDLHHYPNYYSESVT